VLVEDVFVGAPTSSTRVVAYCVNCYLSQDAQGVLKDIALASFDPYLGSTK
jgi:hypothetical protein